MNQVVIQFAKSGYILHIVTENGSTADVFVSTGKLNKAVRAAIEELSLLPKKSDEAAGDE